MTGEADGGEISKFLSCFRKKKHVCSESDQFCVVQLSLVSCLVGGWTFTSFVCWRDRERYLGLAGWLELAVNRREMVICPAVSGRNINTDTVTLTDTTTFNLTSSLLSPKTKLKCLQVCPTRSHRTLLLSVSLDGCQHST